VRAALGMTRSEPQPDARPSPRRRQQNPRRRPAPIPGGLRSDSLEAATHLLTRPGAVLLVDGYNISMWAWPELDIAEQRERLERVLGDLAARTPGLAIDLVFDGAEVLPLSRTGARRARGITVRFTPADVEADDALLELADRYPLARPVIVASDDRRVRDGARQRGANVVSARQLVGVARS
jgi:predicted RNA-binding protein with PIN domain